MVTNRINFFATRLQPNPDEVDYWVDLVANPYGGIIKYYNGEDWVELNGSSIADLTNYYSKEQVNILLNGKADVEDVESKVDDGEVKDVVKDAVFTTNNPNTSSLVFMKYDGSSSTIAIPVASMSTAGIVSSKDFIDFVKQHQLLELHTEMIDLLADIRAKYQRKLIAGNNIHIDENTNVISATGDLAVHWNNITNKPDFKSVATSGDYNDLINKLTAGKDVHIDENNEITINIDSDELSANLNTLTNNLNAEITRATNAETTLQSNIDSEAATARAAESKLTTDLAAEVNRSTTKDAEHTAAIEKEVADRVAAIESLDVTDTAVAKKFVTSVSETDGIIDVERGSVTSTDKSIVLNNNADGGVDFSANVDGTSIVHNTDGTLSVASEALVQYVGENAIAVSGVVDGNKTIYINVKTGEKFLANTADGLSVSFTMHKLTVDEVTALGEDNVKEAYQINDKDGNKVGDVIKVYKDSSLKNVTFTDQSLNFTYVLADGTEDTVAVDMSAFLHESEYADGLQVIDHVVSVKRDNSSEDFFIVSTDGIKVDGIQDAIDAAKAAATTKVTKAQTASHLSVTSTTNADNSVTYTINENDIASKSDLDELETNKVDKVTGKSLIADTEITRLAGIATGAEVNVQSDWNVTDTTSDAYIKNKPTTMTADGGNADTATKLITPVKIWGLDFDGTGNIGGPMTFDSLAFSTDLSDSWSDGTNSHPWYGYDHRFENTGVNSTVISDYFGMRFHTKEGDMVITNDGNVGVGTTDPLHKLDVKGEILATSANSPLLLNKTSTGEYHATAIEFQLQGSTIGHFGMRHTDGELYKYDNNGLNGHKIWHSGNDGTGSGLDADMLDGYHSGDFIPSSLVNDSAKVLYSATRSDNTQLRKVTDTGYILDISKYDSQGNVIRTGTGLTINQSAVVTNYTLADSDWYGVSWSENSSSPDCTRIGNMDMHRTLPILSAMKPYAIDNVLANNNQIIVPVADDFSKQLYNNDTNSQFNFTDDTTYNILIMIPEFWYCDDYVASTKTHNLKICPHHKPGWRHHKEAYVGAYEGYSATVNNITCYTSRKGKIPTVSKTRTTFRTEARANGSNKWNIYTYEEHRAICHLFLVEYATRHSLKAVNTALTAEGFRQGGLGTGCTTGVVNGVYSFLPTGSSDSLGSGSGEVTVTVSGTTRKCNRYRGIENPFGHVWKHCDDIISKSNGASRIYYFCAKPEHFATNLNEYYKPLIAGPHGLQGYKKEIKASINCDFFPMAIGGGETTYWCDYTYDDTDTSEHCLLIGGCSGDGGTAGLFRLGSHYGVALSLAAVGSRLTYLPWAE